MLNLIAFILCTSAAILECCEGNIGWAIFQAAIALLNAIFAVGWLMRKFKNRR